MTTDGSRVSWVVPVIIIAMFTGPILTPTAGGTEIELQWNFDAADVRLERSGQYTCVSFANAVLPADVPGTPWLPAAYVHVLVPPGAIIADLKIEATDELCIARKVLVYPVQEPQPASGPAVSFADPEPKAYEAEGKIPAAVGCIERTDRFRGYWLLSLRLNPLRYAPAKGELYLATHVAAQIICGEGDVPGCGRRSRSGSREELMRMVSNPSDLGRFYPTPTTSVVGPGETRVLSETLAGDDSATYLLITSEALAPAFQVLVDWRTAEGLKGKLMPMGDIYQHYTGQDLQEQIRNCVKDHYEHHGTVYLTLGGDDAVVPDRDCFVPGRFTIPTDLYYGGLDGTWDEDGDGIYGEAEEDGADLYPEVWVGRIPVRTAEEAAGYITKVIAYETASRDGFANTMLLAADTHGALLSGTARPTGYLDHDPVSGDESKAVGLYRDVIQPYWQATPLDKLIRTKSSWDMLRSGDYDFTPEHLAVHLNWGYHHVYIRTHGNKTFCGSERGKFFTTNAMALTNADRPSIVYCEGCNTGSFDLAEPSLSEAFLRNPHGGAVVFIGCSGANYFIHADRFYRQLFVEKRKRIGEAFGYYKMSWAPDSTTNQWTRGLQFGRNLQGDSALRLLGEETVRDLHLSSPHGCEVIEVGSDLTIRWNASATDFASYDTVRLEYSDNSGSSWRAVPGAQSLPYNDRAFTWGRCPLPVGSHYRCKVSSLADPSVSSMSDSDFTIAELCLLNVQSQPVTGPTIAGNFDGINDYSIATDFDVTVPKGQQVALVASTVPESAPELDFVRWADTAGNTLCTRPDYVFTVTHDRTVTAEYECTRQITHYYVNDETAEDGVAAGDDRNDGLSPSTPKRHITALIEEYPGIGWGSRINVAPGNYMENITINSENTGLELIGAAREYTILDASSMGSCIYMNGFLAGKISNFTIRNGFAHDGGGIHLVDSSPIIAQCDFSHNRATVHGGGLFSNGASNVKITDCVFSGNWSAWRGGAVDSTGGSSLELHGCTFIQNTAPDHGAAIHNTGNAYMSVLESSFLNNTGKGAICNYKDATLLIDSCLFRYNDSSSVGGGGAVFNKANSSSTRIKNSVFSNNRANHGGAIQARYSSSIIVENCTILNNIALIEGGGIFLREEATGQVKNSIIWNDICDNGHEIFLEDYSELHIEYSSVEGGKNDVTLEIGDNANLIWGPGNIDADPLFANADNGDFHLKSQAGRWAPTSRSGWVIDNGTSPCIDAGDPNAAVGDEPEPNGGRINMGAYGGTVEASKSP